MTSSTEVSDERRGETGEGSGRLPPIHLCELVLLVALNESDPLCGVDVRSFAIEELCHRKARRAHPLFDDDQNC